MLARSNKEGEHPSSNHRGAGPKEIGSTRQLALEPPVCQGFDGRHHQPLRAQDVWVVWCRAAVQNVFFFPFQAETLNITCTRLAFLGAAW